MRGDFAPDCRRRGVTFGYVMFTNQCCLLRSLPNSGDIAICFRSTLIYPAGGRLVYTVHSNVQARHWRFAEHQLQPRGENGQRLAR